MEIYGGFWAINIMWKHLHMKFMWINLHMTFTQIHIKNIHLKLPEWFQVKLLFMWPEFQVNFFSREIQVMIFLPE